MSAPDDRAAVGESPRAELKIHEHTCADGSIAHVVVWVADGAMGISSEEGDVPLPEGSLDAVMRRFGRPLDERARVSTVGALALGRGRTLRHVRHLAFGDVIARDYLVYEDGAGDAPCALATTVAGALLYLARRVGARLHPGAEC